MIMKMRILILTLLSILMLMERVSAQDFQYSQPFEASMYLNPAFTGSSNFKCSNFKNQFSGANLRFSSLSRSQWNGRFLGNFTGIEHGIIGSNWSFGAFFQGDQLLTTKLNNQYFALISAYTISDNDLMFRFGYQFGIGRRSSNQKNFDFADEFNGSGFDYATTAENPSLGLSKTYLDFSSVGINLRKGLLSLGISGHHLAQPNISIWNGQDKLIRKFSVQVIKGVELRSFKESRRKASDYFYLIGTYKNQGKNNQLDLGAFLEIGRKIQNHHFQKISLGGWFRGIPVQTSPDSLIQRDAVVIQGSWQRDLLRISYSYDIPVSKSGIFGRSHEISFSFQYSNGKCRDKAPPPPLPCNPSTRKSNSVAKVVWGELLRIAGSR